MSIKIIPQEQLEKQNNKVSIVRQTPLLFYPNPKMLYTHRAERMQYLSQNSPFSHYLDFCNKIVTEQAILIKSQPIKQDLTDIVVSANQKNLAPLSISHYPLSTQWIDYIYPLMDAVYNVNDVINSTINDLKQNDLNQLMHKATNLLTGKLASVNNNESLFIWSALSLYYCQLASQLPGKATSQSSEHNWLCPVCQSSPVASIIHVGDNIGLRYLHCSLCESEWHVPRAQCTNCDNLENITYYSLDNELSAIKTECCERCHSYLKVFSQEQEPRLDIIADDINSLPLDMETEKEQFAKSGLNPLLFSS